MKAGEIETLLKYKHRNIVNFYLLAHNIHWWNLPGTPEIKPSRAR